VKRVLVTGASGFIGHHCLGPLLARGYEVHAVRSREEAVEYPDVTWHRADLLDAAEARTLVETVAPTHLLHLAWCVAPGEMFNDLVNALWLQRSIDLMRAFQEAGGRRITVSGSCYEYDQRHGYCSEERTPTRPQDYYGVCKISLHDVLRQFCKLTGLSYSWGRIFYLYGPRENPKRLVASVIRNLLSGKPAPCSHGEQIRDYMSVEDVGDAMAALLDHEFIGLCNVGCGQPLKVKTIASKIGELTGRPDLIHLGALPARANDLPLVLADPTRLKETIGWTPRFDLETGLSRTIDWWRQALAAR